MLRRLLILLASRLLLAPALAQARVNAIEPELVAEGPAPRRRRSRARDPDAPAPGWHGYWLNPGDAGLPMDVQWQLPEGFAVGPLRYPVPARLDRRADELCLRARLCRARAAEGAGGRERGRSRSAPSAMARLHRPDLRSRTGRACARPAGRRGRAATDAQFDDWRRALAAAAGDARRISRSRATSCASRFRCRERGGRASPISSRSTDEAVDYDAPQSFGAQRRLAGRRASAEGRRAASILPGVLALGTAAGSSSAQSPAPCRRRQPLGALGLDALCCSAVLGAHRRRHPAQPHALRVPDPRLKALHLSRAGGDGARRARDALAYTAGAIVGTGALGARAARDPRGGRRGRLGVPAAGSAHDHAAAAAGRRDHRQPARPVRAAGARRRARSRPGASAPARSPRSSRRPAPGRSSALRSARRCCFRRRARSRCSPRSGLASLCPSSLRRLRSGAANADCPSPGAWMDRLQRFLAIPMAATAFAALWLLDRLAGERALLIGAAVSVGAAVRCCRRGRLQRRGKAGPGRGALAARRCSSASASRWSRSARRRREPRSPARSRGAKRAVAERCAAQGKPVFVYFTADWCLTCKVNEAAAIDRDEVREAFAQGGRQGARRRLDQRRPGDHPLPRKPRPRRRAALPLVRAGQGSRRSCRRCSPRRCSLPALRRCRSARRVPTPSCRRPRFRAPAFAPSAARRPWSDRGR